MRKLEFRILVVVMVALSAVASPRLALAKPPLHLYQVYHATFANGSLDSQIDPLLIGLLREGHSQIPDSYPAWIPEDGAYELGITRPVTPVVGAVSAGLFATAPAINFDQGTVFGLRASFVAPAGPHNPATLWAVGLGAKTGNESDLADDTRVAATFHVRGNAARLNVIGAAAGSISPLISELPQDIYDAIFDPVDPQPFTLELRIDRISGVGAVALTVGDWTRSHDFVPASFKAHSGPSITAVGVSLALAIGPGETASVRARDFQIFAPVKPQGRD